MNLKIIVNSSLKNDSFGEIATQKALFITSGGFRGRLPTTFFEQLFSLYLIAETRTLNKVNIAIL